jgi:hypothetical protein
MYSQRAIVAHGISYDQPRQIYMRLVYGFLELFEEKIIRHEIKTLMFLFFKKA